MRCTVDVRGKQSEWGIPCDLSREAVDDMRADGLDVKVIEPIPVRAAELFDPVDNAMELRGVGRTGSATLPTGATNGRSRSGD